ncbi:unnamed protein product, partial [Linum tenue]
DKKELVELLLKAKFYGECERHNHRKCNFFCVTCKGAMLCDLCTNNSDCKHKSHLVFQAYKASEYETLKIMVIGEYLNISHIQLYKINYLDVVYIKARPMRGQTLSNRDVPICEECGRELVIQQEGGSSFKFCSIECKYMSNACSLLDCIEEEDNVRKVEMVDNIDKGSRKRVYVDKEIISKRKHRRKGVPRRSPLF